MCGNCDIAQAPAPEVALRTGAPVIVQAALPLVLDGEAAAKRFEAICVHYDPKFLDVTHKFNEGVYTRTGRIKAGMLIIGAKHRAKNVFHLAKGVVAVWDCVHGARILTGPFSEITQPGMQRVGVVLEDIEGSNIFETTATTVEQAEAEMLFPFCLPESVGKKICELTERAQLEVCEVK